MKPVAGVWQDQFRFEKFGLRKKGKASTLGAGMGVDLVGSMEISSRKGREVRPRQIAEANVVSVENMSDSAQQRLAKLRSEFSRLKAPDADELAMSPEELKRLQAEIRTEGRALIEQLQALAKAGKEPGLVNEIAGRLERTLGKLKAQEDDH